MGLKKKKMGNQREKEEERRGRGSTGRVSEVVARTNRQKERSRQRKCSKRIDVRREGKNRKRPTTPPSPLTIIFRMKNWKYSKSKNKKRKSCQAFDLPVFSVE